MNDDDFGQSVLLILDMQNDIVRGGRRAGAPPDSRLASMIDQTRHLCEHFRAAARPIVYTRVCYRDSYIDAHADAPARKRGSLQEHAPGSAIIDELAPRPDDIVVVKRRVGAFYGTDLEIVLRAAKCSLLVVAGISTPRAVESTVREAHSRDFACAVASDATYADSPELQETCLRIMSDAGFATVRSTAEILDSIAGSVRA